MRALILLMIGLSGCATAHDYCLSHADHYSSYDECYAERSARSERLRQAFSHIGNGGSQARTLSCTSTNYGFQTVTNCQ
jgi:hypothetical protein